jgi:ABC-type proline/glycine betaine transport system permease subunit
VAVLIFFTVFTGIQQVDRRLVERVVTLGGDRWSLVRHVYLPSVAAWVLGSLKIAVGFAFTGACVGEFVAATHGLGYLLSFAQNTYNAALMFELILLILVVVLVRRCGATGKISAALELSAREVCAAACLWGRRPAPITNIRCWGRRQQCRRQIGDDHRYPPAD